MVSVDITPERLQTIIAEYHGVSPTEVVFGFLDFDDSRLVSGGSYVYDRSDGAYVVISCSSRGRVRTICFELSGELGKDERRGIPVERLWQRLRDDVNELAAVRVICDIDNGDGPQSLWAENGFCVEVIFAQGGVLVIEISRRTLEQPCA